MNTKQTLTDLETLAIEMILKYTDENEDGYMFTTEDIICDQLTKRQVSGVIGSLLKKSVIGDSYSRGDGNCIVYIITHSEVAKHIEGYSNYYYTPETVEVEEITVDTKETLTQEIDTKEAQLNNDNLKVNSVLKNFINKTLDCYVSGSVTRVSGISKQYVNRYTESTETTNVVTADVFPLGFTQYPITAKFDTTTGLISFTAHSMSFDHLYNDVEDIAYERAYLKLVNKLIEVSDDKEWLDIISGSISFKDFVEQSSENLAIQCTELNELRTQLNTIVTDENTAQREVTTDTYLQVGNKLAFVRGLQKNNGEVYYSIEITKITAKTVKFKYLYADEYEGETSIKKDLLISKIVRASKKQFDFRWSSNNDKEYYTYDGLALVNDLKRDTVRAVKESSTQVISYEDYKTDRGY